MSAGYRLVLAPSFARSIKALTRAHPEIFPIYTQAIAALANDPYDRSRQHDVKKLKDVVRGEGQFRLRLRRFRFRYDIYADAVVLTDVSLRDESTYR